MKIVFGLILGLLTTLNSFASDPTNLSNWGDMTGKVRNVNVADYPYAVKDGIATVKYQGVEGGNSFGAPGIMFDATPYRGKVLKLSANIKTHNAKSSSLWMRVDGKEGMLAFDNGENRAKMGSTDWSNFSVILPVASDATDIALGLLHFPKGEMSVKSVTLQVTDEKNTANFIYKDAFSMNLADWQMAMGDKRFYQASENDGIASLKSIKTELTSDHYASWNEHFDPKNLIGHRVKFSGEIKTKDVNDGHAGLWMRVDGKGKAYKFDNMKDRGIIGDTEWQKYSVVLDITDESVNNLAFGLLLVGPGQAWLRNVSFASVDKSVKLTK